MTLPVSFQAAMAPQAAAPRTAAMPRPTAPVAQQPESSDIGQRFEQMLWTEMLTYAGLDKAFSQGGGEAASAFSRYVVEAIAKDLSESSPMGLGEAVDRSIAACQAAENGEKS